MSYTHELRKEPGTPFRLTGLRPGVVYYSEESKQFFLVLKGLEREYGHIRLEFLWLTGKDRGLVKVWYLLPNVPYKITNTELL